MSSDYCVSICGKISLGISEAKVKYCGLDFLTNSLRLKWQDWSRVAKGPARHEQYEPILSGFLTVCS